MTTVPREVAAGGLVRPGWRRLRFWVVLAVVVVLGAVLVGTLSDHPGRPLDPGSTRQDGGKALARILTGYGITVSRTTGLDTALGADSSATVLVTSPSDYSADQLRRLAASTRRLVLVRPDSAAATAVAPGISPDPGGIVTDAPGCALPGARAAGAVDLPADAAAYDVAGSRATQCYGGVVVVRGRLVLLGSADVLRNDTLAHDGVAALDVNLITDDRSIRKVVWLLPGSDAAGPGPASLWDLFPDGAHRTFWWLLVIGVLVVLWRARRLGGVVAEPLPVIVRSAEVVEGHGRLYLRAGARDRAAAALRSATRGRIAGRIALPRATSVEQVAAAVAPVVGRTPAEVVTLLAGHTPTDDAGLIRLATDLDRLEAAVGGALTEGTQRQ